MGTRSGSLWLRATFMRSRGVTPASRETAPGGRLFSPPRGDVAGPCWSLTTSVPGVLDRRPDERLHVLRGCPVLEEVGVLEDEVAPGLADLHGPRGSPLDVVERASLDDEHLVHATDDEVVAPDEFLDLRKIGIAQLGWRRERLHADHAQALVRLDELHDLAAVVVDGWRPIRLGQLDLAALVGEDVLLVVPAPEESAGDVASDEMDVDPGGVDRARVVGDAGERELHELPVEVGIGVEHGVEVLLVDEQRGHVERAVGGPTPNDSAVAERRADWCDPRPDRGRPPGGHPGLVTPDQVEVGHRPHRLARARVHEGARPNLVDRELLVERPAGRPDLGPPDRRPPVRRLVRAHLPRVRFLGHIEPAEEHPLERFERAEEKADEDVGAELSRDLDHLQLDREVIPGIDVGIHLVDEMALVLDEQRHRHAVGKLSPEDRLEALARRHCHLCHLRWPARGRASSSTYVSRPPSSGRMIAQTRSAVSAWSCRTVTTRWNAASSALAGAGYVPTIVPFGRRNPKRSRKYCSASSGVVSQTMRTIRPSKASCIARTDANSPMHQLFTPTRPSVATKLSTWCGAFPQKWRVPPPNARKTRLL